MNGILLLFVVFMTMGTCSLGWLGVARTHCLRTKKTRLFHTESDDDASAISTDNLSSPEITRLQAKIMDIQTNIDAVRAEAQQEKSKLKALDDEYGSEIARVKKEFARMKERAYEEATSVSNKAKVDAIKEVLPIADNYMRAKAIFDPLTTEGEQKIGEVYDQLFASFDQILQDFGVTRVNSLGQPFDVNYMEAIMTAPSSEYPKDVVCTEYQAGFRMGDSCVRPAMVVVSLGPGPPS